MTYELISLERRHENRVTEIALGPPPANIITRRLMEELSHAIAAHEAPEFAATRAIVIGGAGKHFSYGASVEEHKPGIIDEVLPVFHDLVACILECPIPTIAKVSGLCLGGGFEVALACSLIVAGGRARFGVPEIKLGVFPPVAAVLLPRMTSHAATMETVLTGEHVDAETLQRAGIVARVVDTETTSLDEYVDTFIADNLLGKSASSLRFACRAVRGPLAAYFREHIGAAERLYTDELMKTPDAVDGITAFLEKRDPQWES